jgi:hypothetical protein
LPRLGRMWLVDPPMRPVIRCDASLLITPLDDGPRRGDWVSLTFSSVLPVHNEVRPLDSYVCTRLRLDTSSLSRILHPFVVRPRVGWQYESLHKTPFDGAGKVIIEDSNFNTSTFSTSCICHQRLFTHTSILGCPLHSRRLLLVSHLLYFQCWTLVPNCFQPLRINIL